jgi:ABC-type transporter Mla subunit MlaD
MTTKYVTPEKLLHELNSVVDQHNAMAADFLRCLSLLSRQLAVNRKKTEQFDDLVEENNRLLPLAQRAQAWREENEHLWHVIADLDKQLQRYEKEGNYNDENSAHL